MKINEIFEKCSKIVLSKRADYTTNPEIDNHENFKRSAEIASWFKHDRDKAYAVLIGTKLARLGSLLSKSEKPNHESVEDTFIDLIDYCALWMERIAPLTVEELKSILNPPDRMFTHEFTPRVEQPGFCEICKLHKSTHDRSLLTIDVVGG